MLTSDERRSLIETSIFQQYTMEELIDDDVVEDIVGVDRVDEAYDYITINSAKIKRGASRLKALEEEIANDIIY